MTRRERTSLTLVATGASALIAAAWGTGGPWRATATAGGLSLVVGILLGVDDATTGPSTRDALPDLEWTGEQLGAVS